MGFTQATVCSRSYSLIQEWLSLLTLTEQIMYSNVHHNWNVHETLPICLTTNKGDEPLEEMSIENGLLTRWNNQNYWSASRNLSDEAANPIPEVEHQKWHLYRIKGLTLPISRGHQRPHKIQLRCTRVPIFKYLMKYFVFIKISNYKEIVL